MDSLEEHVRRLTYANYWIQLAQLENNRMRRQLDEVNSLPWWRPFKTLEALYAITSHAKTFLDRADVHIFRMKEIEKEWAAFDQTFDHLMDTPNAGAKPGVK